jgi:hypothetical protein
MKSKTTHWGVFIPLLTLLSAGMSGCSALTQAQFFCKQSYGDEELTACIDGSQIAEQRAKELTPILWTWQQARAKFGVALKDCKTKHGDVSADELACKQGVRNYASSLGTRYKGGYWRSTPDEQ